ncbi:MAG: hypothetical protein ACUZ8H_16520 [Candidatus Anammoxibacter sp.]
MRRYIVVFILLSMFLLKGVEGSEDPANDFYELKLEIGKISDRMEKLEMELSLMSDIMQSMKSGDEIMLNLTFRLELMEQKLTESPVDTINILKEGVADLRKMMEDQSITINLLEKKSRAAQNPLEPIRKTIEDQVMAISAIIERLNEKEKKSKLPNAITGKSIEHPGNLSGHMDKIMDMFPALKEGITTSNILKTQGYQYVGEEFYVKGIAFIPFGLSMEFTGTVMNTSGADRNTANFRIFLYDDTGILLMSHSFTIRGINRVSSKSFSEIITGVKIEKIGKYAFVFGENSEPGLLMDLKHDNFENEDFVNKDLVIIEEKLWELPAQDGE